MPKGIYKHHPCPEETKVKIGLGNKGKVRTEETKVKIGKASAKRWLNKKYKENFSKKISKALKGRPQSIEVRVRRRETMRRVWENPEYRRNWKGRSGCKQSVKERRNHRISALKYIKKCKGSFYPRYNLKACEFFKELNQRFCLNGFHAENIGEFGIKELGYWLDYYESSFNLVIEWNERKHFNPDGTFTKKHFQRQNEIKRFLKCKFINIKEESFNKEKFFNKIGRIVKKCEDKKNAT